VYGITASAERKCLVRPDLSVLEGAYLRDILDQPRALEDTLAALKTSDSLQQIATQLQQGKLKTVILTGMGASYHALHPLNLELLSNGFISLTVETSELIHYQNCLLGPTALVVAVSQSGRSAEIVRLLEVNEGKSPIIAITNTADSPLALQANATILTRAGKESSVSCKTYVTALMALQWFGHVLCGIDLGPRQGDLSAAPPAARNYLAHWEDHVLSLSESVENIESLFLVGRGPSLAAVGTGALIIKESTHFHAEGMSSAAFRHGPFEMLSARTFVLVFAGESKTRSLNQGLLEDIRNKHGRVAFVAEDLHPGPTALPAASAATRPILEILPVQMITLALAAQVGREPGRFELASKVTTNE
jgi:glutamine---fructose-6-phosphate transaminase (isomerizing)